MTKATPLEQYKYECQELYIPTLPFLEKLLVTSTTEINLTKEYIGDKQAMALAAALKLMKVKKLILPLNGIMNNGCRAILAAVEGSQIENIDFSRNDFSPSCVKDICRTIANTPSLENFNVVMCAHMKPEHTRKIEEAFLKKTK